MLRLPLLAILLLSELTLVGSPGRIVAIGDVHGNATAFVSILQRAGLIDHDGNWAGGRATLVQTGDLMDRGPEVREALDLLMKLEEQAPTTGGRVVALLGNHETLNLMGETRDATPAIYAAFADEKSDDRREAAYKAFVELAAARAARLPLPTPAVYQSKSREEWMAAHPPGYLEYREALEPTGPYGRWLRSKSVVAQIGGSIFVHGGINADVAPKRLEDINDRVRKEIQMVDDLRRMMIDQKLILPYFTFAELLQAATAALGAVEQSQADDPTALTGEQRLMQQLARLTDWWLLNDNGPLWYRGYLLAPADDEMPKVVKMLKRYEANHIIVGHTPPMSMRITPLFSARVVLIDTGMLSTHYPGGRASALEIRDGRFTAIYLDGRSVLVESAGKPAATGR